MLLPDLKMALLALGACLLMLVVLKIVRGLRRPSRRRMEGGIEKLLAAGKYEQAAARALADNKLDEAREYYLRAQMPERAAQMAMRMGDFRQAAELYEVAGNVERACYCYEQAGMREKADELRRARAPAARPPTQEMSPMGSPHGMGAQAGAAAAAGVATDPGDRARRLDADFRAALAAAGTSTDERARAQDLAREAAEALLGMGEIRRAADVYRDGGMDDEAIHLYVNVLGSPGEAAPILGARGNHERAAELYEIAGQRERAAAAWVHVARAAKQPETYVDRIEGLDEGAAVKFVEELVGDAPPTQATVEIHYRLATMLEKRGESDRAIKVFGAIHERLPNFRDVLARIETLRANAQSPAARAAAAAIARPVAAAPAAPPAAAPEGSGPVSLDEFAAMAREAALAALSEVRKDDVAASLGRSIAAGVATAMAAAPVRTVVQVVGLERAPVALDAIYDPAFRGARGGPSVDMLRQYVGGRSCDLQNIEVYYRMGLAHLATGKWKEALDCFDAVEDASPGYRDAEKRADAIRGWQKAVDPSLTGLGGRGAKGGADSGGRYVLLGELGRGGMAVVYRARDTVLGREVALKFISEDMSGDADLRDMFQREARAVAQLNHPNIVTVHDFGTLEGRLFICMEYVEGKPVEQLLAERRRLDVVEALRTTVQVLDALEYAHVHKIIHRDIKPSNMMKTKTGLVKLMDFGLAKSIEKGSKASVVAGTPHYMAPEQFRAGDVDGRADLFAVGVSLYQMLAGDMPFEGLSRDRPAPTLRMSLPELPSVLDNAILKALEFDPAARFQTAAEFAAPLRYVLQGVERASGASAGVEDRATAPQAQPASPPGRTPPLDQATAVQRPRPR